jgi:hypothetical protein
MADILTFIRKASLVPNVDVGQFYLPHPPFVTPTSGIANGDYIRLFAPARNVTVMNAWLQTSGTLGASCTLRIVRNRSGVYTNMTATTTAGAASLVTLNIFPIEIRTTDFIELLVGGAAVTAAATVSVAISAQTN